MTSIGSPSPFFLAGKKKAYAVDRSLRFNTTDQTILTKALSTSPTNRKKTTLSFWFKKSKLSTAQGILTSGASGTGGSTNGTRVYLNADDTFKVATIVSNTTIWSLDTNRKFRDPSAWMHFCMSLDTTQSTASDRVKIYINGVQETSFSSASYPSQDYDDIWAYGNYRIGDWGGDYGYYIGYQSYIAEVVTIDGQALDPSSFTETDATTGQLVPKDPSGLTFGTNGFYLNFSDNSATTATTLGKDSSGNGNNFTPTNFITGDSVQDSPTNNFCTFNPLKVNASTPVTYSEGNLQYNGVSGNNILRSSATIPVTSGKWYVEFKMVSGYSSADSTIRIGIITSSAGHRDSNNDGLYYENTNNATSVNYGADGAVYLINSSQISGLTTYTNNDVMGIALDLDNDKFFVSKNGTWFSNGTGTQDPAAGTNPLYSGGVLTSRKSEGFEIAVQGYSDKVITADFGQQGFAYTPPTGFKAISSANLPDPTILLPNKHFDTLLYTGDGSSSHIIPGLNFQPDWVWLKSRSAAHNHGLMDAVRGRAEVLFSNSTSDEKTSGASQDLVSFNSNGITVGTPYHLSASNNNGTTIVAWNWNAGGSTVTNNDGSISSQVRANTSAGFSIVGYTGTGSNATVGHGLGVAPKVLIVKERGNANDWTVYHESLGSTGGGDTYVLFLNLTNDKGGGFAGGFNNTAPTSSVFSLGNSVETNRSSGNFITYCFSEVKNYSKFGSYTGNGNADGTFVFTGFRPAFLIVRRTDSGDNWVTRDAKRNSFNDVDSILNPNSSGAEFDASSQAVDFVSNGVKIRGSDSGTNASGGTYIYLAFAESPFKYSRAR